MGSIEPAFRIRLLDVYSGKNSSSSEVESTLLQSGFEVSRDLPERVVGKEADAILAKSRDDTAG